MNDTNPKMRTNRVGEGAHRGGPVRAGNRGIAVYRKPIIRERLECIFEFGEVDGLHEEGSRAGLVSPTDLPQIVARGKNDCPELGESRLCANPFQNVKAIVAWHFQVEEKEIRQRELVAPRDAAIADK